MHSAFEGILPEGWSGGEPITKHWRGDFIHLYRVHRPCSTCGTDISLDVSKRALEGTARNTGLLLRNCPSCREQRKAGGPGSRGGRSRPVASEVVDVLPHSGTDAASHGVAAKRIRDLEDVNKDLQERLKESDDGHAVTLHAYGQVRKALHEQLGLSLLGDGITYDTVSAAIRKLKGEHVLHESMKQVAEKFDPHAHLAAEIAKNGTYKVPDEKDLPW